LGGVLGTDMTPAETIHETVLDSGIRQSRLARVYAEALLQAALKQSPQAPMDVGEEMLQLRLQLIEHPEVAEFLASPALGKKGKLAFLENAVRGHASHLLRGLIEALWQNNRLNLFRSVVAAYLQILNDRAGRVLVKVTAAVPLTDEQKDKLVVTLREVLRQEPVLNVRVDPELLGGLIIQAGDTVIDSSVRSRLQSLRTHLLAR
jgi:F-type H+-transporting ATPase subunit delta